MTSVDEANGWYGGTLLGDQDENSDIYKHYAELCQVIRGCLFELCHKIIYKGYARCSPIQIN